MYVRTCVYQASRAHPGVVSYPETTKQVHARIGSSQMPQVPAPLDPKRFGAEISAHLAFWQEVRQAHGRRRRPALTMTPEYGPAPYSIDANSDVDSLILRAARGLRERLQASGKTGANATA